MHVNMFRIDCSVPRNSEPWVISLSKRIQIVSSALNAGRKIAFYIYRQPDNSTFRYRCYNIYQITKLSEWQSVYFYLSELSIVEELLDKCNLLVLARVKWSYELDLLVRKAKKKNISVVFDVDDLICNIQYLPLLTNTLNVHFGSETDYDFWFADISRHQAMASCTDGFITTNDYLGKKLSEQFNKPYQVICNSLNEEQLAVSEKCRRMKAQMKSAKPFVIGYFSGTPSHINDFKVIYKEMIQLLTDYPEINLKVVGFMEFPSEMTPFIQKKRVTFTPLVNFLELQRLIAQVDVNIVPLVNNAFTNCKSELKYFEASAVDTITVASPTYTYAHAIADGKNGFLCQQGQWYDTINNIYLNKSKIAPIIMKARNDCLHKYCGDEFRKQVCDVYNYFEVK